MKKSVLVASFATLILVSSCVDKDYNLKNLDKSITILPGIEVQIKNGGVLDKTLDNFLSAPEDSKKAESGAIAITADQSEEASKKVSNADLASGQEVKIPGSLITKFDKTNDFLNIPDIGPALSEPSIVITMENPSPYPAELSAKITDGKIVKDLKVKVPEDGVYNIYVSENGNASAIGTGTKAENVINIKATAVGFSEFFSKDIPDQLEVSNISIKGVDVESANLVGHSPVENNDFSVQAQGVIYMCIGSKSSFSYQTKVDIDTNEINITSYNFREGDQVVLKGRLQFLDVPLEFTPTVTEDSGKAKVRFSPTVVKASQNDIDVEVYLDFVDTPVNIDKVNVALKIYNPTDQDFSVTGNEKFAFSINSITATNGVNF